MSKGFSAALLAGGRSTRMGEDKAFLSFGEPPIPLWKHQLLTLGQLKPDQLLLSQNADQDFGSPEGVGMVVDDRGDCGPLGGLASCLRRATSPRVLVLAVDLPYMTVDFLETLLAAPGGVVLQDSTRGRYEPVVAAFGRGVHAEVSALTPPEEFLQGMDSVQGLKEAALDLAGDERPALLASAVELILEGLHLHNRLNKSVSDSGESVRYGAT